jgi:hypothetical protein
MAARASATNEPEVAAAHVGLDDDAPLAPLALDVDGPSVVSIAREPRERDPLAAGAVTRIRPIASGSSAVAIVDAQRDREAPLALLQRRRPRGAERLDDLEHVGRRCRGARSASRRRSAARAGR